MSLWKTSLCSSFSLCVLFYHHFKHQMMQMTLTCPSHQPWLSGNFSHFPQQFSSDVYIFILSPTTATTSPTTLVFSRFLFCFVFFHSPFSKPSLTIHIYLTASVACRVVVHFVVSCLMPLVFYTVEIIDAVWFWLWYLYRILSLAVFSFHLLLCSLSLSLFLLSCQCWIFMPSIYLFWTKNKILISCCSCCCCLLYNPAKDKSCIRNIWRGMERVAEKKTLISLYRITRRNTWRIPGKTKTFCIDLHVYAS